MSVPDLLIELEDFALSWRVVREAGAAPEPRPQIGARNLKHPTGLPAEDRGGFRLDIPQLGFA